MGMSTRLSDLSLVTLVRMLKATQQAFGANATSVRILRRAIMIKRQNSRKRRRSRQQAFG
jgi:hypothetical protein